MTLLEVSNFSVSFTTYSRAMSRTTSHAVNDISMSARAGEVTAVVGASGSGKSLLAHALLGILPTGATEGGRIEFAGSPLTPERRGRLRGSEIVLIPQALESLDPLRAVGAQLRRAARLANRPNPRTAAMSALLQQGLPPESAHLLPHQLSGGMARRALTAMATMGNPRLVIADEPTPGLDPEAAANTLAGLRSQSDQGAAVVLITHQLDVALSIADQVVVVYEGTTVEFGPAGLIAAGKGAHPYTKALWNALPANGFVPLPGGPSSRQGDERGSGCVFAPRCPVSLPECETASPPARSSGPLMVWCVNA